MTELEEALVRTRKKWVSRAIENIGSPADADYERARGAFYVAAIELADHLIRQQERTEERYKDSGGPQVSWPVDTRI